MISGKKYRIVFFVLASLLLTISCGKEKTLTMDMDETETVDPKLNKGIGPIKEVKLDAMNSALAERGKKVFESKCAACHKFEIRVVGPALQGVTQRRSPEWIMNLILNTNEMVEKDPIVKGMIAIYMTKMTLQDVKEEEARGILEYFRQKDSTP